MKKRLPVIIVISTLLLAVIAAVGSIIFIKTAPQRSVLTYAKHNCGSENPVIKSERALSDREIEQLFYLGDRFDFSTYTYKDGFPESIEYTITSDNQPEYHIYYLKCHGVKWDTDKDFVVKAHFNDLTKSVFNNIIYPENKELFMPGKNPPVIYITEESQIDTVRYFIQDCFWTLEDYKAVNANHNAKGAGIHDELLFYIYFPGTMSQPDYYPVCTYSTLDREAYYFDFKLSAYDIVDGKLQKK